VTRKRRSGITVSEALLAKVIRVIEGDDSPLDDPDLILPMLRVYHSTFMDLLEYGPLDCVDAVAQERPTGLGLQPGEVGELRANLMQFLESTVRGSASTPITASAAFTARLVDGRATVAATGPIRDLIVLQLVMLVQEVGLANVHACKAPDCHRIFVKVYRRAFCSVQCQKRFNTREQRRNAKERRARLTERRRRQRRKEGA
jgi:hypothetical protein